MAPLPPNNTPRFKFNYIVGSEEHDFQVRSHASPSAMGTHVNAFLTALGEELYSLTITSVEFAADGSNIFLPVTTGIEGNVYGTGTPVYEQRAWDINFIGRTGAGKRWRLMVFGIRTMATDYRYVNGENVAVDDAIIAIQAWGADLVGIDDTPVTVYKYANAGVNAHWQRALRP